jgi:hypothetical protein
MIKQQDPEEEEGTFMNVRKVTGYSKIETRYDIPFSTKTADEMHEFCDDAALSGIEHPTQYSVKRGGLNSGARTKTVYSFKDWRNGDFDELERFSRIPTATERQIFEDEKAGKVSQTTTVKPYS